MSDSENICDVMHSYARRSLEPALTESEPILTPLPETPDNRPTKKAKQSAKTPEALPTMMALMLRIEKMQEETLARLVHMESAVKENSSSVKSLAEAMDCLAKHLNGVMERVDVIDTKLVALEKENAVLRERVEEMDAYKRRWNLRVAGLEERAGENVKQLIVDLFSEISPDIADKLPMAVDVAHRLGPRSDKERSSRRIIVQFISRSHRDKIWRDARTSTVLKQKKIRILEDLTQSVKEARNKLWPLVEQARKKGKRAGFRGASAVIDGKRISAHDM